MKSAILKYLLPAVILTITLKAQAAWEPTFVDNFNGNNLDQKSWVNGRENLPRRLHYYHKDAVDVKNGKLDIKVLNRSTSDRPYTTGAVTTQGLFAQKYGYFEMRAKMPKGDGFWPAFWLMPTSGQWSSEIDIVEFIGDKPDTPHYAFHYGHSQKNQHSLAAKAGKDLSHDYNTYGLKWTANKLEFYLNGQLMHKINGSNIVGKADSPMYVILNLALASQNTGWIKGVARATDLSQDYSIDYIRVYKESPTGRYQSIPGASATVPDKLSPAKYDNTPVSIESVVESGQSDVMRSAGRISGKVKLTAHAPLNTELRITLFQLKNFDKKTGKYAKSSAIETVDRTVSFSSVGQSMEVPYNFRRNITSTGVYIVDVTVRDNARGHKNAINAHRIVQYLDSNRPNGTLSFSGFVKNGSASYANDKVTSSINVMLHESLLAPYLITNYQLIDDNTQQVVLNKNLQSFVNHPGAMKLNAALNVHLDAAHSYSLKVRVSDSSGKFVLNTLRYRVGAGNSNTNNSASKKTTAIPQTSGSAASKNGLNSSSISAIYAVRNGPEFSVLFDTILSDGQQINQLNYIIKLYTKSGSFVRKISGTYTGKIVNGRQTIKIKSDGAYQMTETDYRIDSILYKDGWNPSDIIAEQSMEANVADRR